MKSHFIRPAIAASLALGLCTAAAAQSPNPVCQRLEAQLVSLDRGNNDPVRAEQIRRADDAVRRQQFEVDRLVAQGRRLGCERSGFFSIFSNPPPQCGPLNRQIDQQRSVLERMQGQLEQVQGGTAERAAARQSLLVSLSENNCGPQYRSAAIANQQGGFFERLFGGFSNGGFSSTPQGPLGGTFRTVCVRTCDGYYFPISFSTAPDRFSDDEQTCQRMCPAAQVSLYSYHNPGEEIEQATSLDGRLYTELPTAFQYRKALNPACSCRRPGESWAQALKVNGADDTLAPGDVVVTEQNAKRLSQPLGTGGKPVGPASGAKSATPVATSADTQGDPSKRKVRTVGPTFLPAR
jgi:hypothetical protein